MENSKVKKERKVKPLYWFITAWAVLAVAFGVYFVERNAEISLNKFAFSEAADFLKNHADWRNNTNIIETFYRDCLDILKNK